MNNNRFKNEIEATKEILDSLEFWRDMLNNDSNGQFNFKNYMQKLIDIQCELLDMANELGEIDCEVYCS